MVNLSKRTYMTEGHKGDMFFATKKSIGVKEKKTYIVKVFFNKNKCKTYVDNENIKRGLQI